MNEHTPYRVPLPWAAFWGKARSDADGGPAFHPVAAHALDVAAVAMLLPRATAYPLPRQTLGFLVALHDIGKFSRGFQSVVASHWPSDVLGPAPPGALGGPRHDLLGYGLLMHEMGDRLDQVLPPRPMGQRGTRGWTAPDLAHLFQALAGHHGRPVAADEASRIPGSIMCAACIAAAQGFVDAMLDVFRPPPVPIPTASGGPARLGWDLAGVVTLADWVGSRQAWFPYASVASVADPRAYLYDHALPRAAAALGLSGLSAVPASPYRGIRHLFPTIITPSPMQAWAEGVPLPAGPVLAVIEDGTGSGKTEAAVTLAHRLLDTGQASGAFLALPTMATANAMFERMSGAYRGLFADDARPSLVLAHGRAGLDPRFAALIEGGSRPDTGQDRAGADPADIPSEAQCAAWLADDRRRALLAQFGVGTIDQAILAVLPVRHAVLRLQGLKGKVLIVDEAHAFDAYMQRELVALLHFHAALGGSAILLSATLTHDVRQRLTDAFRSGLNAPSAILSERSYPLATLVSVDAVLEQPCALRDGLARRVAVTRLPDVVAALARVAAAARASAAVAWIRNTVDDALAAADMLRDAGFAPLVFHARFAMVDRLGIEAEVLRRFGRGSNSGTRGTVLVATQVIEQSLDLDFDLICTDLAPADLLIQRAGRLWRHQRAAGERPLPGPELLVVSPDPVDDPAPDWIRAVLPGTAAVYRDPALLWRGARAVFAAGGISTPGDMRPLVEQAGNDAEVPAGFAAQTGRAEGKGHAAREMARQNVLDCAAGYTRQNGAWDADTQTSTRLEDRPQVTLRLAVLRNGAVVPYAHADTPARAWALSEVTVAAHRVAACPVPPGLEAAVAQARSHWGRWERDSPKVLLAVLTPAAEGYTLAVLTEDGSASSVRYERRLGLLLR